MKKEKLGNFFKGKGFYTALAVGTVAILAVGILNTNMISDNSNELAKNPSSQMTENSKQEEKDTSESEGLENKKEEMNNQTNQESINDNTLNSKESVNQENLGEEVASEDFSSQEIVGEEIASQDLSKQEIVEEVISEETTEQKLIGQETTKAEPIEDNEISDLIEPAKVEAEPIQKVEVEEKVAEVISKESQISSLNFSEEDGLLWPVQGNVILEYSMDKPVYFKTLEQYKCNSAIAIEAKEKTEVFSVAKCMITDISNVDETGITVKASIGNDYEVIYGQLSDVKVEVGDIVEAGAVIGTIGAPTKYYVEEGSHLYFKVLAGNEPVNPLLLLN